VIRTFTTTLISTILVFAFSDAQSTYTYTQPQESNDGWETASLKEQGVDTARVYHLFSQMHQGGNKVHSVLLVKDNKLIIEEYFNGQKANEQHDLRSATKSIISLLVGIALDKGYINSLDDPITTYLKTPIPEKNLHPKKDSISLRHLLTMATGLDCNDWDPKSAGQEDRVYRKKDWIQYTLDLPLINEPGTVSQYCTMGVILMAEIISRASGMPIDAFAAKYLFEPLSITNVSWGHTSSKEVIASGKRLYMTSRDMAKIGQLLLNKGMWEDKQIVSSEWIKESTTTQTSITGREYGYLWWNIPLGREGQRVGTKVASGNGGQYIMVVPELDMVAVFTGGAYNSQEDKLGFAIMTDIFLPTFNGEK
tara:strand:+ start:7777 stop:8874 length:1098 start_codon:yes stop_codon:yes gene_type:complete